MNLEKNKILDEFHNNNMEIKEEILEESDSVNYYEIDAELKDNLSFYCSKNFKNIFSNKVFEGIFKEEFKKEENIDFHGLTSYIYFSFNDLNNYKDSNRTIFNFVKKFEDFKFLAPFYFSISVKFKNSDLSDILKLQITGIIHSFGVNNEINTFDIQDPEDILYRFAKYKLSKDSLIKKLNYMAFENHPVVKNNNLNLNELVNDPENLLETIKSYESLDEITSY